MRMRRRDCGGVCEDADGDSCKGSYVDRGVDNTWIRSDRVVVDGVSVTDWGVGAGISWRRKGGVAVGEDQNEIEAPPLTRR